MNHKTQYWKKNYQKKKMIRNQTKMLACIRLKYALFKKHFHNPLDHIFTLFLATIFRPHSPLRSHYLSFTFKHIRFQFKNNEKKIDQPARCWFAFQSMCWKIYFTRLCVLNGLYFERQSSTIYGEQGKKPIKHALLALNCSSLFFHCWSI